MRDEELPCWNKTTYIYLRIAVYVKSVGTCLCNSNSGLSEFGRFLFACVMSI